MSNGLGCEFSDAWPLQCRQSDQAAQNIDANVGDSPSPLAFHDQAVVVCTESAEGAKPAAQADGHGRRQNVAIGPAFRQAEGDPRQNGGCGQVGSECTEGKGGSAIEPNSKQVPEHGACSTAQKDADDEGDRGGVHGAGLRSLKRCET